jgi:hypothetical protein
VRGKNGHVCSGALNVGLAGELCLLAPQRCFPLRRQHAGSGRSEDAKAGAVSRKPKTTVSKIATVRRIAIIVSSLFVWFKLSISRFKVSTASLAFVEQHYAYFFLNAVLDRACAA